jgi:hypothetical protein
VFLYRAPGSSLVLGFDQVINLTNTNGPKLKCCKRDGTKTMTKINAEGLAWGVSKRAMAAGAGGILRTRG